MKHFILSFILIHANLIFFAQCNILPTAIPGITLVHQNTNCFNNSGVAYNPIQDRYYAVRSGNVTFPLETWTGTGVHLLDTFAGFDWRGMWWNPALNQLEGNGYLTNGLYTANLNAAGDALSTGTVLFTGQNQPDAQSVGDLDFDANEVLYYFSGMVHRYNRSNMSFISSYLITGTPVILANLNTTTLMYTGCPGKEIALLDHANKKVYLYNKANGAFVGASTLPASAVTSNVFRTSFANCLVWLFDLPNLTWHSYKILDNCGLGPTCTINTSATQKICNGDSLLINSIWQSASGSYKDTFTSVGGCDSIHTINLVISPLVNTILNASICQGNNFFGYTSTGIFLDTFSNISGCDSLRTINLTVKPKASATVNQTICQGGNYFGHTTTGVYLDTFLSATGCDSVRTVNLTVTALPNVSATALPANSVCKNASLTLQGTGALSYTWSNGVQNNISFVPASSNIYTITGTDINGCTNTKTIAITVLQNPILNISSNPTNASICKGTSIALTASGGLSYVWSHGQANGSAVTPQITTTYTVVAVGNQNCTTSGTKNVIVYPVYNKKDTITICEGSPVNYNGVLIQSGGINVVKLQTIFGCDSIIELFVKQVEQPKNEDILPNYACKGSLVNFTSLLNNSSNNIVWKSNTGILQNQNQNNASFIFNNGGLQQFSVTITPPSPCLPFTIVDEVEVHEAIVEVTKAGNNNSICNGDTIILLNAINKGYQFNWQPAANFINNNAQSVRVVLPASTTVTLTVTDTFNCSFTDTISLNIVNCCQAYLPNAFSPDNNGKNDIFTPILEEGVKLEKFTVFNQWGETVFKTNQINKGWDGYYKGKICEIDSYFYLLDYSCGGKRSIKKGDVKLLY